MPSNPKTFLALLATSLITCLLFGERAQAVSIEGTIGFYGFGSVSTAADTTTVNFSNPIHVLPAYGYAGDYGSVPPWTQVTFKPISYMAPAPKPRSPRQ